MKGFVVTSKGIEKIAAVEIKELINANCKIEQGCAIFDFKDFKDLCLLCYKAQSVDRVACLINSFESNNFPEDLKKFIEKLDINEWLSNHKKFRVECIRIGTHDFNSVDIEKKIGEYLVKKFNSKKIKVSIKDYEIVFLAYIVGNKCHFGVDFAGFELNKRSYKIFLHPNSLRGTIAYALIRESSFEKTDIMLDPFSRDGVIAIEAAFYAISFPYNYYKKEKFAFLKLKLGINNDKFFENIDKKKKESKAIINSYDHLFKFVDYSKKNAKIAGVDKFINFSRIDLEWLDIKFKKESVDRIITNMPSSKNVNLDRIHNEFFYQAEYILKKTGAIGLITRMPDAIKKTAAKHNFSVAKESDVWSGEQLLKIIVLKKKTI